MEIKNCSMCDMPNCKSRNLSAKDDCLLDKIKQSEEPVRSNIDFEQELYKAFGQVKDFTLGMRIAKWFYDMGKNSQEPVSEELEKAAIQFATDTETGKVDVVKQSSFFWGAIYHKHQMMAKAVDAKLLEGHLIRQKGVTHPLHVGDKVKVIIIKEGKL